MDAVEVAALKKIIIVLSQLTKLKIIEVSHLKSYYKFTPSEYSVYLLNNLDYISGHKIYDVVGTEVIGNLLKISMSLMFFK